MFACSRLQYNGTELRVLAFPAVCIIYSADGSEYRLLALALVAYEAVKLHLFGHIA